jgi:ABC-2 type transport system ATP-binding protein
LIASTPALVARDLVHRYGAHTALNGLSLDVGPGETFALLGPNGSGKTTLFRLISTLVPVQQGSLSVFGQELPRAAAAVRQNLGVVFQSTSTDAKLSVIENLRCQAALYGLSGPTLRQRLDEVVAELGLAERLDWRMDRLSGGLARRVDIAKCLLHAPRLLLLDEPSTGLDPAARLDLWHALQGLRQRHDVTIIMTTHLLEEAEKVDRIGILHRGQVVAVGAPQELRSELGSRILTIDAVDPEKVIQWCAARDVVVERQEQLLRVLGESAADIIAPLTRDLGNGIRSLSLGQPSLEDVFIARTGHRFWDVAAAAAASDRSPRASRKRRK